MHDSAVHDMTDDRLPVTLVTGFLGAGKTTLLNTILSDAGSEKVAVIVNEFGDAGLDHDLIEKSEDEVILMPSGCLCCSIRGELTQTIQKLFSRRDEQLLEFNRLVIETTGLADPGPIMQTLLVDRFLAQKTRLDGIVTVVDMANGPAILDAQFEAVSQIAMADLIILSKTDLVSSEEMQAFETRIRSLNSSARILPSVKGNGVHKHFWGLHVVRRGIDGGSVLAWLEDVPGDALDKPADPLANLSGLAKTKSSPSPISPHDSRIGVASIILDEPVAYNVFDTWLDTLIKLRGPDILRVKGIVFLEGVETPFVFHGVQHIFDPPIMLPHWTSEDRRTRIVVIARDLTRPELQSSLDMLRATPAPQTGMTAP